MNIFKKNRAGDSKLELQIAPLIDVVFLLLIYFMVTASLIKKEGDISFFLPTPPDPDVKIDLPIEAVIQINADSTVVLEGMRFTAEDRVLSDLTNHIKGLKQMADSQESKFFVNLSPAAEARHVRVIDVMDACAAAQVETLTFSKSL